MNIRFDRETEKALREYVKTQENCVIRLKVLARGWGKPALGIALDEQRTSDIVRTINEITFAVSREEEADFRNVEILHSKHYVNNGFYVRSFNGR